MASGQPRPTAPAAQVVAARVFGALERFLHIEAVSGAVLLIAAAAALLWANSPGGHASYEQFWHTPLTFGVGQFIVSQDLHFWINDALMAIFFLVVGTEIRRESHEGALASLQLAALPLVAALGGVAAPAIIYFTLNPDPELAAGWAVPTATDIAFAVGVLALLGRRIPSGVRILLLALAIIDDIAAVLIIALFYSGGLDFSGLLISGAGVLLVLIYQQIGVRTAFAYIVPGAVLWLGMLKMGIHPSLAGVILGLLTPVSAPRAQRAPIDIARHALAEFSRRTEAQTDHRGLAEPIKELKRAQRELLPPVVRVQLALHPWVTYGVMPLFALANAGVPLDGLELTGGGSAQSVMVGVCVGLIAGKPMGIFLASWLAVKARVCRLPPDVSWSGVLLVGLLGGIGFTMSIFIANLAFEDEMMLAGAKGGVLLASAAAGVVGLLYGRLYLTLRKRNELGAAQESVAG